MVPKRHHVMKLINGDTLLKLMAGGGDPDYAHHLETNLFPKCTLDPADLLAVTKELELRYYRLVQELERWLQQPRDDIVVAVMGKRFCEGIDSAVVSVLNQIQVLESGLPACTERSERGPVAEDAVSRKKVLKIVGEEVEWHLMATRIEKLPSVVPVPPRPDEGRAGRSEEEIILKREPLQYNSKAGFYFLIIPRNKVLTSGGRYRREWLQTSRSLNVRISMPPDKGGTSETG